jgi:hypothetical protein
MPYARGIRLHTEGALLHMPLERTDTAEFKCSLSGFAIQA